MAITLNGTTGITNDGGYTGDGVSFADTTPANTLVTTTDGNVGIGTASPNNNSGYGGVTINGTTGGILDIKASGSDVMRIFGTASQSMVRTTGATPLLLGTNDLERMRIDSSGNLLIGKNADSSILNGFVFNANGRGSAIFTMADTNETFIWNNISTAGTAIIQFRAGGVAKGQISWNNTNTTYTTTSDYRLKENIAPMTGALATVAQLKPVTYDWKVGGSSQGFIAHELAEVCPEAVSGEKDAVDEEGKIKPQGIDTSFLVATLTAAIQELKIELDSVKAELATLKGAA